MQIYDARENQVKKDKNMSKIGYGYGSEWHLLRYLGYHRQTLNSAIEDAIKKAVPGQSVRVMNWLEHRCKQDSKTKFVDAEWTGLDFLADDLPIKADWKQFWPQTGNQQNWDAVGIVQVGSSVDLLLVEAKAHIGELESKCGASEEGGRGTIREAIEKTQAYYNISPTHAKHDWLNHYYQYANRMCALYFLNTHNVSTRLLYIYFTGEDPDPKTAAEWNDPINNMYKALGVTGNEPRVHKIFLPICPV